MTCVPPHILWEASGSPMTWENSAVLCGLPMAAPPFSTQGTSSTAHIPFFFFPFNSPTTHGHCRQNLLRAQGEGRECPLGPGKQLTVGYYAPWPSREFLMVQCHSFAPSPNRDPVASHIPLSLHVCPWPLLSSRQQWQPPPLHPRGPLF